jgi:hypothetical protein
MGYSIGYDENWNRDIGYGVPAVCDHPDCAEEIDRGLSYVCGEEPFGGGVGCGLYFCEGHRISKHFDEGDDPDCAMVCARCADGDEPFAPKPDVPRWAQWKLTHASWATWRAENAGAVEALRGLLPNTAADSGSAAVHP